MNRNLNLGKEFDVTPDEITQQIIGCCYKVHQALGSGFLEKVYENALMIELENVGLKARQQFPIAVHYGGRIIGEYFADILVEEQVVCELKASDNLAREHEVQLVNYLAATGYDTGLLINFGRSVAVKRKFRTYRAITLESKADTDLEYPSTAT